MEHLPDGGEVCRKERKWLEDFIMQVNEQEIY
jgi:hypothetical protein